MSQHQLHHTVSDTNRLMVTRFAASTLRTDNCPQPKEAQPRSHALTTSNQFDILTTRLVVWSGEGALNWRCFLIQLLPS
jgi:hypothetical protein